jgi:hypothetical protein
MLFGRHDLADGALPVYGVEPVMKQARPAVQLCWPQKSVKVTPSSAMRSMFGVRYPIMPRLKWLMFQMPMPSCRHGIRPIVGAAIKAGRCTLLRVNRACMSSPAPRSPDNRA